MLTLLAAFCISTSIYLSKPFRFLPVQPDRKIGHFRTKKEKVNIQELREVIEVLILALGSGMTVPMAIRALNDFSEAALAKRLNLAVSSHAAGANLTNEFSNVGNENNYWKLITTQLQISWEQGARVVENFVELNEFFIDLERAQILKKVKSAGVKSVIPLGLCFLPAFMLVVVVPLVAGLINF